MKKNLTKIVIALSCTIFISACHTLEHNGFKLKPSNKLTTNKISEDNKNYKSNSLPEKSKVKKIIK